MSIEDSPELLAAKINSETSIVNWKELEILYARGNVFLVSSNLDLVDVALKVTNDDKAFIQKAMQEEKIVKPNLDWVKNNCQPDTPFWATVVAPFVFIQQKKQSNETTH